MDTFNYGKSYWKFNNSLCIDKVFVEKMNDEIRKLKEEITPQFSDNLLLWDFHENENERIHYGFFTEKCKS